MLSFMLTVIVVGLLAGPFTISVWILTKLFAMSAKAICKASEAVTVGVMDLIEKIKSKP